MHNGAYPEVDKVISYILEQIDEPLSLSDLSRHAGYSPYHFSRLFKLRLGMPPLYYVSLLRLQRAKELLLHTPLPVRDIGLAIGQQSLGTFSTRFTERVGVTPAEFRRQALHTDRQLLDLQMPDVWKMPLPALGHQARVQGVVQSEIPFHGVIFLGLFARPIPEGVPLYGTLASQLGEFCIPDVKPGIYYLMATAVSWDTQASDILLPHATLRTRSHNPVIVATDSSVVHRQVTLYPPRLDDPPILVSLPLLMRHFLQRAFA